jgi:hypothetical protein
MPFHECASGSTINGIYVLYAMKEEPKMSKSPIYTNRDAGMVDDNNKLPVADLSLERVRSIDEKLDGVKQVIATQNRKSR